MSPSPPSCILHDAGRLPVTPTSAAAECDAGKCSEGALPAATATLSTEPFGPGGLEVEITLGFVRMPLRRRLMRGDCACSSRPTASGSGAAQAPRALPSPLPCQRPSAASAVSNVCCPPGPPLSSRPLQSKSASCCRTGAISVRCHWLNRSGGGSGSGGRACRQNGTMPRRNKAAAQAWFGALLIGLGTGGCWYAVQGTGAATHSGASTINWQLGYVYKRSCPK